MGAGQSAAPSSASQTTMLGEVIVEFGRHLDMLAAQLGTSLMEADRDSVSVGESFHELSAVKSTLEALPCGEPAHSVVKSACCQIGESLHTAVIALQYHDRLAQRLALVRAGLLRLQTLLQDRTPRSYDAWLQSLRDVEQVNRHEQKRLGPAIEQAGTDSAPRADDSVELF